MDQPVFSISPDPTALYQTPSIKESLLKIRHCINLKQGLSAIFGDVGLGKSSMLRYLLATYSADENCKIAFLTSGDFPTRFMFLKKICSEFEVPPQRTLLAQLDAIEEFLAENHAAGRTALVMVDEAQLLSLECLEMVRSLLNYETNTEKMVQVILSGQLDLFQRLSHKRYRAFRSRIFAPVMMQPLTPEETVAMIAYRLDYWGVPNPFVNGAHEAIYEVTKGVPRDILLVCQHACISAEARGVQHIDSDLIHLGYENLLRDTGRVLEAAAK